jgi:hypothetical protein
MSQQHMNFEEDSQREQVPPAAAYDAGYGEYRESSHRPDEQKITERSSHNEPSAAQRLGLAIVSLGILMIITINLFISRGSEPFLVVSLLGIVAAVIVLINYLFNRRW